ncbi:MAG TPA: hypothetical protein VLI94_01305 [Solirubrobacterales bacterium]|nr:hypothetical protein [Solirubrobacterales bacterium]
MAKVKDLPGQEKEEKIILKSGEELTPQLEEELAAEAERGYDLSTARVRHLRQPILGDESSLLVITYARSQPQIEEIHRRAKAEGRHVSEVAREMFAESADPELRTRC